MSGPHVGDPIAHRFIDRFLECRLADRDRNYFRAEKCHTGDVQRLPLHVDLTHVDDALASEPRSDSGGSDSVLAGAGFGNDATLAHALREQNLSERVVDFVRARVKKVLAFEINFRTVEFLRETFSEIKGRRPAGEIAE